MSNQVKDDAKNVESDDLDAETLLAQRQKLEAEFRNKFVRIVTLMFTDLKGSTSMTEEQGDLATRELLKTHNDILFPIIEKHRGNLVKTMGDGTMSYFEDAQDAVETAIEFQAEIDRHNRVQKPKYPIQVRIGINTGEGIVEKDDVYGDVVNVASRFESIAEAGEIYFSKSTFDALRDAAAFYCRKIRTATLKGKKEEVDVFKAFWSESEIQTDQELVMNQKAGGVKSQHSLKSYQRLLIWVFILVGIVFGIMQGAKILDGTHSGTAKRSTIHTVD